MKPLPPQHRALPVLLLGQFFHAGLLVLLEHLLVGRQLLATELLRHSRHHAGVVLSLEGALLAACGLLGFAGSRWTRVRPLARWAAAVLLTGLTLALTLLYVANHFLLPVMGRLLDAGMLSLGLEEAAGWLTRHGGPAAAAGAAAALLLCLGGLAALCRRLLDRLFPPQQPAPWRASAATRAGRLALLALLGLNACGFIVLGRAYFIHAVVLYDPVVTLGEGSLRNTLGTEQDSVRERRDYALAAHTANAPRNVVVIAVESLRADHLPLYGYARPTTPFLSRLSAEGRLRKVEKALAAGSESVGGIFAILGSKTMTRAAPASNFMLHTLLKDQGYSLHFLLSGSHTRYRPLPMFYGPRSGFAHYTDGDLSGGGADDRELLAALKAMPSADGRPHFFFFFLMSTHALGRQFHPDRPFQPTPSFEPMDLFQNHGIHSLSAETRQQVVNRYDDAIVQADAVLEQIFALLEEKGYLQDAAVFITGDHAEGLGERGVYGHAPRIEQEFVNIPLLICDPSAGNYRNLAFASQTDIAPTVLDLLGLPKPPSWEGLSLRSGPQRTVAFTQNTRLNDPPCRGVTLRRDGGAYAMIQCEGDGGARSEEVFDLGADPLGLQPCAVPPPRDVLDELRRQLAREFPVRKNHF